MNVDQALQVFRDDASDPREALQWAVEHWDEASTRLLSKLRAIAANLAFDFDDETFSEGDSLTLFYLVHLFAEKHDKRAYAPLCERLLREKNTEIWLGDAVTESLAGVLIALCDGDIEPIQRIAENAASDEFIRAEALDALSYLIRFENALDEPTAREYLRQLYERGEPRGISYFWLAWSDAVANLGYSDLAPDVARLFSKAWIDPTITTIQHFHGMLAAARSDAKTAFAKARIAPFASTIGLIDSFDQFGQHSENAVGTAATGNFGGYETPHINPVRDVGRNDPCPCGSGKKYKKCCLAA